MAVYISSEYLWIKEKDQFSKFPHILCFSEHHLKQIELEQINLEGYKLGAVYSRKSLPKGEVCIFVHKKYNCPNEDLTKYCKEQDIEACTLKLELTALNIHVVTVCRALACPQSHLSVYQKGAHYSGIKVFNRLPVQSSNCPMTNQFKMVLKGLLYLHFF
jgi:hypothetical protein